MEKHIVSLDTAKLLKKHGFREEVCSYYIVKENTTAQDYSSIKVDFNKMGETEDTNLYSAPTLHDAQDWLREKLGIHIEILLRNKGYYYKAINIEDPRYYIEPIGGNYPYYEAINRGIRSALEGLELIKEK